MTVHRAFVFVFACVGFSACSHGGQSALTPAGTDPHTFSATALAAAPSHIDYFPIGSSPSTDVNGLWILQGPDGNLYYDTVGPLTCDPSGACTATNGSIGRFNPASHSFTKISLGTSNYGLQFTPDGALWTAQYTAGKIARLTLPLSSSHVQEIAIPGRSGFTQTPLPKVFANGSDGDLWFVDQNTSRVGKINPAGPYTPSALTMYILPNGPSGTPGLRARPFSIARGPDGNMWVADRINGTVDQLNTSGVTMHQFLTPEQQRLGSSDSSFPAYLGTNGAFLYLTQTGSGFIGNLDRFTTAGGFGHIRTVANADPYFIASRGTLVVYADVANGSVGLYHTDTGNGVDLPANQLSQGAAGGVDGVTIASDGSVWFTCFASLTSGGPLCVGHIVLTSVWSVFPSTTITLRRNKNGSPPQLIGIAETGNSGPFTVVSSNTNVVRVTASPNSDHNFYLGPEGYGRAFVTVTDHSGRSQRLTVTVTT